MTDENNSCLLSSGANLLTTYFDELEKRWSAELSFLRASVDHNSEKGSLIETALRRLLERHIPERFGITSGFVVDTEGSRSRQCDIIIYDRLSTPFIFRESISVIPVECALLIIEIKARVNKDEMTKIFRAADALGSLNRHAYVRTPTFQTNLMTDSQGRFIPRLWSFCLEAPKTNETWLSQYRDAAQDYPAAPKPLICFCMDGRFLGLAPEGATTLSVMKTSRPFAHFIAQIAATLALFMPTPIDFFAYAQVLLVDE